MIRLYYLLPALVFLMGCGSKSTSASSSSPATTSTPAPNLPSPGPTPQVSPTIQLSWTNADNGQSGFIIEGSSDGVTFQQVLVLTSGTATSATIPDPGTAHYYVRIRATNSVGSSGYSQVLAL